MFPGISSRFGHIDGRAASETASPPRATRTRWYRRGAAISVATALAVTAIATATPSEAEELPHPITDLTNLLEVVTDPVNPAPLERSRICSTLLPRSTSSWDQVAAVLDHFGSHDLTLRYSLAPAVSGLGTYHRYQSLAPEDMVNLDANAARMLFAQRLGNGTQRFTDDGIAPWCVSIPYYSVGRVFSLEWRLQLVTSGGDMEEATITRQIGSGAITAKPVSTSIYADNRFRESSYAVAVRGQIASGETLRRYQWRLSGIPQDTLADYYDGFAWLVPSSFIGNVSSDCVSISSEYAFFDVNWQTVWIDDDGGYEDEQEVWQRIPAYPLDYSDYLWATPGEDLAYREFKMVRRTNCARHDGTTYIFDAGAGNEVMGRSTPDMVKVVGEPWQPALVHGNTVCATIATRDDIDWAYMADRFVREYGAGARLDIRMNELYIGDGAGNPYYHLPEPPRFSAPLPVTPEALEHWFTEVAAPGQTPENGGEVGFCVKLNEAWKNYWWDGEDFDFSQKSNFGLTWLTHTTINGQYVEYLDDEMGVVLGETKNKQDVFPRPPGFAPQANLAASPTVGASAQVTVENSDAGPSQLDSCAFAYAWFHSDAGADTWTHLVTTDTATLELPANLGGQDLKARVQAKCEMTQANTSGVLVGADYALGLFVTYSDTQSQRVLGNLSITPGSVTGSGVPGGVLEVTPGEITAAPALSGDPDLTFQWQRCTSLADPSVQAAACTDIPGATGADYRVSAGDVGEYLRVVITVSAEGFDPLTSVVPFGSSPISSGLSLTGMPAVGGTLAATLNPPFGTGCTSPTYRWYSQAPGTQSWTLIAEATTSQFSPDVTLHGHLVKVEVTATCGQGQDATEFTRVALTADPVGPSITTTGAARVGEPLTAVITPKLDGCQYTFQWQSQATTNTWNNIAGATSETFTPTAALRGSAVRVAVTATCGTGNGAYTVTNYSDGTAAVAPAGQTPGQNSALTGCVGTLQPRAGGQVRAGGIVDATITGCRLNGEAVTPSYTYTWSLDGKPIDGYVPASATSADQVSFQPAAYLAEPSAIQQISQLTEPVISSATVLLPPDSAGKQLRLTVEAEYQGTDATIALGPVTVLANTSGGGGSGGDGNNGADQRTATPTPTPTPSPTETQSLQATDGSGSPTSTGRMVATGAQTLPWLAGVLLLAGLGLTVWRRSRANTP